MTEHVTIIGNGGWGTALATVLARKGTPVTVWGPFTEEIEDIRRSGQNATYLPGLQLSGDIAWSADLEAAMADASAAVIAIPTRYFRDIVSQLSSHVKPGLPVLSVAKGLDSETHEVMTVIAEDLLDHVSVCALSGPSHAEEVAREVPTAVVVAGRDTKQASFFQSLFMDNRLRVYTSEDVFGIQLGGALKNVIAVAVGISDGLGFGDNTRAALISRGLVEMTRLGIALGADPTTFTGLSGMGDLIVTCTSRHSRNRGVGERIGRGESIDDIMSGTRQAVEGVWNCQQALHLARANNVDVPITEQVHAIVHKGRDPREAVEALLSRNPKPE